MTEEHAEALDTPKVVGAMLHLRLFGDFAVVVADRPVVDDWWPESLAAQLVKLLALAPGYRLPTQQVLASLWPGRSPNASAKGLQVVLRAARRVLAPAVIMSTDDHLGLVARGIWLDVAAFEEARQLALAFRSVAWAWQAIDLYQTGLLPGDLDLAWLATHRERLHNQYRTLLLATARWEEEAHHPAAAIAALTNLLAVEPEHLDARHHLARLEVGADMPATPPAMVAAASAPVSATPPALVAAVSASVPESPPALNETATLPVLTTPPVLASTASDSVGEAAPVPVPSPNQLAKLALAAPPPDQLSGDARALFAPPIRLAAATRQPTTRTPGTATGVSRLQPVWLRWLQQELATVTREPRHRLLLDSTSLNWQRLAILLFLGVMLVSVLMLLPR